MTKTAICPHCQKERLKQGLHQHKKSCKFYPGDERLRQMYVDDEMTIKEISTALGMPKNYNTVSRWLGKLGVELRPNVPPKKQAWESDDEALRDFARKTRSCEGCDVHEDCHKDGRNGRPAWCEGPLVSGKIIELDFWQRQGWMEEARERHEKYQHSGAQ